MVTRSRYTQPSRARWRAREVAVIAALILLSICGQLVAASSGLTTTTMSSTPPVTGFSTIPVLLRPEVVVVATITATSTTTCTLAILTPILTLFTLLTNFPRFTSHHVLKKCHRNNCKF